VFWATCAVNPSSRTLATNLWCRTPCRRPPCDAAPVAKHLDRSRPLGVAVSGGELGVDDQRRAVLHQQVPCVARASRRCCCSCDTGVLRGRWSRRGCRCCASHRATAPRCYGPPVHPAAARPTGSVLREDGLTTTQLREASRAGQRSGRMSNREHPRHDTKGLGQGEALTPLRVGRSEGSSARRLRPLRRARYLIRSRGGATLEASRRRVRHGGAGRPGPTGRLPRLRTRGRSGAVGWARLGVHRAF